MAQKGGFSSGLVGGLVSGVLGAAAGAGGAAGVAVAVARNHFKSFPGEKGATGNQGHVGDQGHKGHMGGKGHVGSPVGATGATGATGHTGPQNPVSGPGATGATGPDGSRGPRGPQGTGAYVPAYGGLYFIPPPDTGTWIERYQYLFFNNIATSKEVAFLPASGPVYNGIRILLDGVYKITFRGPPTRSNHTFGLVYNFNVDAKDNSGEAVNGNMIGMTIRVMSAGTIVSMINMNHTTALIRQGRARESSVIASGSLNVERIA